MTSLRGILWQILGFGILPAWLLAGAADWLCHRRTEIERTSGRHESALHLLLHAEIAVPAFLALWLEINAGLLLFMAACVFAHMITSLRDTKYAQPRRFISPFEQQVHSWLEMLPLFAVAIVAALHWDALADPRWLPEPRAEPVPAPWPWLLPLAFAAGAASILEEYLRDRRAPPASASTG